MYNRVQYNAAIFIYFNLHNVMRFIISCIFTILGKFLITVGILGFIIVFIIGVTVPPWVPWLLGLPLWIRLVIAFFVAVGILSVLLLTGSKLSHIADSLMDKKQTRK